ncbi:MAG: DNA alkylation repair protein [Planctomycetes bacterium]|nr:DNA alkylation repair protein [Planctomycetota bacterium]
MQTPVERTARDVIHDLRAFTNPERRASTLGYFPSAMENLGVAVPDIRRVLKATRQLVREWSDVDVHDLARAIVAQGTLEGRQLAYELIASRKSLLHSLRKADVLRLGEGMDNWVSVDVFSCSIAGQLWRERALPDAELLRWARSRDRWWRRAALASTIPLNLASRGGKGDVERTLLVCERLAADREEMVAKALSWALRTLVPISAVTVETFLAEYEDELAARVLREVRNKLHTGRKNGPRT